MHLLVRDSRTLDEAEAAVDPALSPADLVLLSFSDSDLAAAAAAWEGLMPRPSLRLANLGRLRHPMSVDLLVEQIACARCVVVRLLGGLEYWRYGVEEVFASCRARGVALAVVPGDGRDDARLAEFSTVPREIFTRLDLLFRAGGVANVGHALRLAAHLAGQGPDARQAPAVVPAFGEPAFGEPVSGEPAFWETGPIEAADAALAVVVFYRSQMLAGDMAPVTELARALAARGLAVRPVFVASLKEPGCASYVREMLRRWRPAVVLNATLFSARDAFGSPLDDADAPVLQVVMAGSDEATWRGAARGLSAADLAMQVVLPESDGRLLTTAISFKAASAPIAGLDFCRSLHQPWAEGIALAADRAAGWVRLARTKRAARLVALVLSDYPGGQTGHAVGLDSFASAAAILRLMQDAGYAAESAAAPALARDLCGAAVPFLSIDRYRALLEGVPAEVQRRLSEAWGAPEEDPALCDGWFALPWRRLGGVIVAVQPDRGSTRDRRAGYHDPETPPRHAYVAFYLWLRVVERVHALIHLGTHGTLEWLPGKAVALSQTCFPQALIGGLPVIYPFIVNNPGEAACARRRLGAVTIGHLTPPLRRVALSGEVGELEALIDEYAAADGLDRRRAVMLRGKILDVAGAAGLLAESGVPGEASPDEALARLDAYLCDVKALAIRDGLHVFGVAPDPARRDALVAAVGRDAERVDACAPAERAALLAALDGRFVQPGPAGAPGGLRADVLPTGRNLATIDPRGVPTRTAMEIAARAADALMRRHRQDQGEWLRTLVLDLWGSASLRTGGEDFALALILIGARPVWDDGSQRVSGVEILPLALLDRPRVDVTLRISGLFRDAFAGQIVLFDEAVRAIAGRDEAADWNPLAGVRCPVRVFGPPAGCYGTGVAAPAGDRAAIAAAYLRGSGYAYGRDCDGVADRAGFAACVAGAGAFLHQQDHAETDLLDSAEYAAHEGGFAAAAAALGGAPALYHGDTSRPDAPMVRDLAAEIVRVVRGRAANPDWVRGMMRHGTSGAAEIARAVEALQGFAAALPTRFDRQFDLLFDATLGDPAVALFLAAENRRARDAMAARFVQVLASDLWRPRRNDVREVLG